MSAPNYRESFDPSGRSALGAVTLDPDYYSPGSTLTPADPAAYITQSISPESFALVADETGTRTANQPELPTNVVVRPALHREGFEHMTRPGDVIFAYIDRNNLQTDSTAYFTVAQLQHRMRESFAYLMSQKMIREQRREAAANNQGVDPQLPLQVLPDDVLDLFESILTEGDRVIKRDPTVRKNLSTLETYDALRWTIPECIADMIRIFGILVNEGVVQANGGTGQYLSWTVACAHPLYYMMTPNVWGSLAIEHTVGFILKRKQSIHSKQAVGECILIPFSTRFRHPAPATVLCHDFAGYEQKPYVFTTGRVYRSTTGESPSQSECDSKAGLSSDPRRAAAQIIQGVYLALNKTKAQVIGF